MTACELDALRLVAAGDVVLDPRYHGFCGAREDVIDALTQLGLVRVDWHRDVGRHPRFPRHPVILTPSGQETLEETRAVR